MATINIYNSLRRTSAKFAIIKVKTYFTKQKDRPRLKACPSAIKFYILTVQLSGPSLKQGTSPQLDSKYSNNFIY